MPPAEQRRSMPAPGAVGRPPLAALRERVYEAEVALHAARQAGRDDWICAAYGRLHEALAAERGCAPAAPARPDRLRRGRVVRPAARIA